MSINSCSSVQKASEPHLTSDSSSNLSQITHNILKVTGATDLISGCTNFYHVGGKSSYSIAPVEGQNGSWRCSLMTTQGSKDWICNGSYEEALRSISKNTPDLRFKGAKELAMGIGKATISFIAGYLLYCGVQQYVRLRAPQVCQDNFALEDCARFFPKNQTDFSQNNEAFFQWKKCADKYHANDCNKFLYSPISEGDSNEKNDQNVVAFESERYEDFANDQECRKEFAADSVHCDRFASTIEYGAWKNHLRWHSQTFFSWKKCRKEFNTSPEDCDQFINRNAFGVDFGVAHDHVNHVNVGESSFILGQKVIFPAWQACAKKLDTTTCNLFIGKGVWSGKGPLHYIKTGETAVGWSDYLYERFLGCHKEHSLENCKQFLERKSSFMYLRAQHLGTALDLSWNSGVKWKWDTCLKTGSADICNKFIVKSLEATPFDVEGLQWNEAGWKKNT